MPRCSRRASIALIFALTLGVGCRRHDEVRKDVSAKPALGVEYRMELEGLAPADRDAAIAATRDTLRRRAEALGLVHARVTVSTPYVDLELDAEDAARFHQIEASLVRRGGLDFALLADEMNFVGEIDLGAHPLPSGASKQSESLPLGAASYLRLVTQPGETREAASARLRAYVAALGAPDDVRVLLGWDREKSIRTYVVFARTELTDADIVDARATFDGPGQPYVALTFTPASGAHLYDVTAANVKRRLAIVLDDWVESAPVIQQPIGGGKASITLGADASAAEATSLAAVLRAHRLPVPLVDKREIKL